MPFTSSHGKAPFIVITERAFRVERDGFAIVFIVSVSQCCLRYIPKADLALPDERGPDN